MPMSLSPVLRLAKANAVPLFPDGVRHKVGGHLHNYRSGICDLRGFEVKAVLIAGSQATKLNKHWSGSWMNHSTVLGQNPNLGRRGGWQRWDGIGGAVINGNRTPLEIRPPCRCTFEASILNFQIHLLHEGKIGGGGTANYGSGDQPQTGSPIHSGCDFMQLRVGQVAILGAALPSA